MLQITRPACPTCQTWKQVYRTSPAPSRAGGFLALAPAGLRNLLLLPLLRLPGPVAANSIVVSCVLRRAHTWEEGTALLHLSLCRGVPGRAARGPRGRRAAVRCAEGGQGWL